MTDAVALRAAIRAARDKSDYELGRVALCCVITPAQMRLLADAAESTLPTTKAVEVWHVEWTNCAVPKVSVWPSHEHAQDDADKMQNHRQNKGQWNCIRVTGPHQHEVPHDSR